jgi:phenylalanyl-tRNA synthetase beta chain
MKVPLSWLSDFVDVDLSPEELAHRLTMAGLEVAGIERIGEGWDNIWVGEIREVRPHPNADRLVIAVIEYGRPEPMAVVTGAPNIRPGDSGQKVAFAEVGARLTDGHTGKVITLKPAKLRGVTSKGMACSEKELGLSDEHEGILILDEDAPTGVPLPDHLGDVVLDIEVTPNRPDCLSVMGVAREVAALTGGRKREPGVGYREGGAPVDEAIQIEIWDPDLCYRYSATLIRGVTIGPSPNWMQRRLLAAGMRPINNVVDVTNYVMWEWGQPLHAFDYELIRGQKIIVRRAGDDGVFTTLDGEERSLSTDTLMIADESGPVAVAGVMGGLDSEVTEDTTDILLESANFNNVSIRRTSQALRLRTEASIRFDKGLDREMTVPSARRATRLIQELAGGEVAPDVADNYPTPWRQRTIEFDHGEVERLLGVNVPIEEAQSILERLEFEVKTKGERLIVEVPSYRGDVGLPADLVEEVARVWGYENIPTTMMSSALPPQRPNTDLYWESHVREMLVACGLQEVVTYSLTDKATLDKLGIDVAEPEGALLCSAKGVGVANPLTPEQDTLRTTLMASMLMTVSANLRHQREVGVFEIARIYIPREGDLPQEKRVLTLAAAGDEVKTHWLDAGHQRDYFDVKGAVTTLLGRLGIQDYELKPTKHPTFQAGRVAELLVDGRSAGVIGEVDPDVAGSFDVSRHVVAMAELDFEVLSASATNRRGYRPLPKFPGVVQDLAVVVDETVPAEEVLATIRKAGGELLAEASLFDVYTGDPVPEGKRSLAYALTFRSASRTLKDDEAQKVQSRIQKALAKKLGAELRV